jgi:chromosome partitioning protein
MRIAIFNGKGGVGKSTIAANLAALSVAELLDADPQATCCYWKDRRKSAAPNVTDVSLGRVAIRLQAHPSAVVDLPGASVPGIQEALRAAHIIIVPVTYDQASLDALPATLELVRSVDRPSILLINRLHPRTSFEGIRTALSPLKMPICPVPIRERVIHRDWWTTGEVAADYPDSESGQEIKTAWQWLSELEHG